MPRSIQVDRQEFARLWADGVPAYGIAERLGIHANTVTRLVSELKLPSRRKPVDVPALFRLWGETSLTRAEVARHLGVTANQLTKLAEKYGLGRRSKQHRAFSIDDPTPEDDAASANSLAIAPSLVEACEAAKQRHFAQRRAEHACNTYSKVSKWRAGICQPR